MNNRLSPISIFGSLIVFLAFWVLLAWLKADNMVLPYPWEVARIMMAHIENGQLLYHAKATLIRVLAAFSIAMLIGCFLGVLLGSSTRIERVLTPWIVIFQNTPALVVIVLCYLWIGLNETAAIAAVSINKIAMVAVTIREGTKSLDRSYVEMAHVYKFGRWKTLRYIIFPHLIPFLFASARNGLAVIWKIVLVVEFLGRSNGIGFQIHLYFQMFDVSTVLAYSFGFVAIMGVIEYLILQPIESHVSRWRA
jgi:NitT/TauT family transport system permease protein